MQEKEHKLRVDQKEYGEESNNNRLSSSFLSVMVSEIVCSDMRVTASLGAAGECERER